MKGGITNGPPTMSPLMRQILKLMPCHDSTTFKFRTTRPREASIHEIRRLGENKEVHEVIWTIFDPTKN